MVSNDTWLTPDILLVQFYHCISKSITTDNTSNKQIKGFPDRFLVYRISCDLTSRYLIEIIDSYFRKDFHFLNFNLNCDKFSGAKEASILN